MARNSLAMGKASIKTVKKGTFSRIIKYVFKNYAVHMIIVFICLFLNTAASVRGTMFMETLFNDYIEPVLKAHSTDLSGLVAAIDWSVSKLCSIKDYDLCNTGHTYETSY